MNPRTILLVDDDSDLLQIVGERCRSIGLNVHYARNLLTATTAIERCVPDIVCVDIKMPTGNGLRFCETLRADPRSAHVPIIVLTGRKDEEAIRDCADRRPLRFQVGRRVGCARTARPSSVGGAA